MKVTYRGVTFTVESPADIESLLRLLVPKAKRRAA